MTVSAPPPPHTATPVEAPGFEFLSYGRAPAPKWLWHGILEQGTVTLLSGAKSVMKSYLGHGLTAAMLLGHEEFLGRRLTGQRVLTIDTENPAGVPLSRLYALGARQEHWTNLRYAMPGTHGVPELGSPAWNSALVETVDEFDPHLIVVDGSLSATNVSDTSDTEGIKRLYNSLRHAIQGHPAAVLLYHHERKRDARFGRGDGDMAAIGSVYWLNLADAGYALERKGQEIMPDGDGRRLCTTAELDVTKPPRVGIPIDPTCFAVDSRFDAEERLHSSTISLSEDPEVERLVEVLLAHDEPTMKSGAWAQVAGYRDSSDSQYDRIRRRAIAAGYATKVEDKSGVYKATDEARAKFDSPELS